MNPYRGFMNISKPAANHTFFMLVRTTNEWIRLTPKERFAFVGDVVAPILRAHPTVNMRYFDSEAFSANVSDIVMWETADVMAYQAVVESLRETPFWGHYFEIREIVASVENAYAISYDVAPL
jgi:hypothetical protein